MLAATTADTVTAAATSTLAATIIIANIIDQTVIFFPVGESRPYR